MSFPGSNIQVLAVTQGFLIELSIESISALLLSGTGMLPGTKASLIFCLPLEPQDLCLCFPYLLSEGESHVLLHWHIGTITTSKMVHLATESTSFYESSPIDR